jgi:hypothetical protein
MKRKILFAISAATAVILILTAWLVWMKGDQSTSELAGSWMLYEGGYVASEVLTFNEDGTGVAYALSDTYPDNSMTNVQIPRSCLDHAEDFRWSVESGALTFIYADGDSKSYEMSFYTMTDVRMLSLNDGSGGGGYVPAEIVD